jgi:hypothetical protein
MPTMVSATDIDASETSRAAGHALRTLAASPAFGFYYYL